MEVSLTVYLNNLSITRIGAHLLLLMLLLNALEWPNYMQSLFCKTITDSCPFVTSKLRDTKDICLVLYQDVLVLSFTVLVSSFVLKTCLNSSSFKLCVEN